MKSRFVKNLIAVAIILVVSISTSSCKNSIDLTVYVSELRSGIYEGTADGYTVSVSVEEREDPFILDGFVGAIKKVLTVKLEAVNNSIDDASITLNYDGYSASGSFVYSPLNGKYVAEIFVDKLPNSPLINGSLKSGDKSCSLELKSKVLSGNLSYNEILEKIKEQQGKRVDELFNNNSVCTEIHIRIICEKTKNYYYVGFTEKSGKTYAYLVDAKTGEILAEKQN